jgi:hypothetical protein
VSQLLNYFAESGEKNPSILELINGDSSRIDVSGDYRLENICIPTLFCFHQELMNIKEKSSGKK